MGPSIHLSTPANTPTPKTVAGSSLFPTDMEFISTLPYCRQSLSLITSLSGKCGYAHTWTHLHTHTRTQRNVYVSIHSCPLYQEWLHHWSLECTEAVVLPTWSTIFCPSFSACRTHEDTDSLLVMCFTFGILTLHNNCIKSILFCIMQNYSFHEKTYIHIQRADVIRIHKSPYSVSW